MRPFAEVKEQVLDTVMSPEIDRRTNEMSDKIAARLAADFAAWQKSKSGDYGSFAYLERLAADIEKQHQVRPTVTSKANEWTPVAELGGVPGIGRAVAGDASFGDLAKGVQPLAPAGSTGGLQLQQFSKALKDLTGNAYFFRVTEAEQAHAPKDIAEIRGRLEEDVRVARGYQQASEEAKRLLKAAEAQGLTAAASMAKQKMITTGSFDRTFLGAPMMGMPPQSIPGYEVAADAKETLIREATALLSNATAQNAQPRTVIELPDARKVLVAELAGVSSRLPTDAAYQVSVELSRQIAAQRAQALVAEWLTYPAVKARLDYRPDQEPTDPAPAEAAAAAAS